MLSTSIGSIHTSNCIHRYSKHTPSADPLRFSSAHFLLVLSDVFFMSLTNSVFPSFFFSFSLFVLASPSVILYGTVFKFITDDTLSRSSRVPTVSMGNTLSSVQRYAKHSARQKANKKNNEGKNYITRSAVEVGSSFA